jgi:urease accessory protein
MNRNRFTIACLSLLIAPETSLAHSPIEGIGNFYNGLLHPVMVPAHLLLLTAVGIFLGQQGTKIFQTALAVFGLATVAGLVAAWFSAANETEAIILLLSAVTGLLIAIAPKVTLPLCAAIALLAGFLLAIDSAQEQLSGKDRFVSLFGSGIAIYLLVLYPMALADYLNKKTWQKTGIRIVGSWIAASSFLVLALKFSPQA